MSRIALYQRLNQLETRLAIGQFLESLPDEVLEDVAAGQIGHNQLVAMMRLQSLSEQMKNTAAIIPISQGVHNAKNE